MSSPQAVSTHAESSVLLNLLQSTLSPEQARTLLDTVAHHPDLLKNCTREETATVSRAELAHAMNLLLLHDLLQRVPESQRYVEEKIAGGQPIVFDHGALRTVAWENQSLPSGYRAFSRILEPLGFRMVGEYPLARLKMCGFVFCHEDYPEDIAQFFVSELYPQEFSEPFQLAVDRVVSTSRDPLSAEDKARLQQLEQERSLPLKEAVKLLPALVACFDRQHEAPGLEDYTTLLDESAEMAWISTEGNAFNHGTDRVADLHKLDAEQKALGRPMKPVIEVAVNAHIQQTAYRATMVEREFRTDDGIQTLSVPGSFFEFIQRDQIDTEEGPRLDLRFDSRNAQGIFTMTRKAD